MQAYKKNLRLPQYLFVTIGWYRDFWWTESYPNLTCTVEEIESMILSSLSLSDEIYLDRERDANITTTSGIVRQALQL